MCEPECVSLSVGMRWETVKRLKKVKAPVRRVCDGCDGLDIITFPICCRAHVGSAATSASHPLHSKSPNFEYSV